jgi:bisphosphoglycerate-dependent phosphoglycerate mutase
LKVTHPLAIALKPSNTLNAMLESCDFDLLYTFWCHTVNPLIKENRIILAVADGEVERALLKYLYCVRFLRWFTNPIPTEACLLMSLSKQWCFGHTKEGHLVINKIYFSKKRNEKKFN